MGGSFIGVALVLLIVGPLLVEVSNKPVDRAVAVTFRVIFNFFGAAMLVFGVLS